MTVSFQENNYEAADNGNSSSAQCRSCNYYYSGQKASSGAASLGKVALELGWTWKEAVGDTRSGKRIHNWQGTKGRIVLQLVVRSSSRYEQLHLRPFVL